MAQKAVRVEVIRPFFGPGFKLLHAGTVTDLPELLASEVIAANKAQVTDKAPAEGKPVERNRTPGVVGGPPPKPAKPAAA